MIASNHMFKAETNQYSNEQYSLNC